MAAVALYALWKPAEVFDNVRVEDGADGHPLKDLKRLVRHWPIYPALLIWLLWNFAPGSTTPLQYHLQNTLHATDAQWGQWNAIFAASFIPTYIVYGLLCRRFPLKTLLLWGTIFAVPQMVPLLFIDTMTQALIAAVPIGLMGGLATGAYLDLIIRSCPRGLQGTTLMMSNSLYFVVVRFGDVLGTNLYDRYGGFTVCVIAITIVYALILPALLLVPERLDRHGGRAGARSCVWRNGTRKRLAVESAHSPSTNHRLSHWTAIRRERKSSTDADKVDAAASGGQAAHSGPCRRLGIVFGDIGTSPLYTFKTILGTAEAPSDPATVLGALSLVLWTLFIITTVKYVSFAMRVDNDGEGGILALMALLGVKKQQRPTIVAVGLFGAALIYGDGAITPAISVLSALEGLNMATPALQPYVVPAAVAILLALFAIQSQGTATIGRFFGPIMLLWFLRHGGDGDFGHRAASCGARRRSIRSTACPICSRTARPAFWCWARCFSASPAPRRSMPTWAISAAGRSSWPGSRSCFRA